MRTAKVIALASAVLVIAPALVFAQGRVLPAETGLALTTARFTPVFVAPEALEGHDGGTWVWRRREVTVFKTSPAPTAVAEKPHRFFDALNIALTDIESGALLADGITTQRGLTKYPESREADPIARLFVSHGWPGQIVGGILFVSADVGLRHVFHRNGRHRVERLLPLILTVYGTIGAIHNARLLNRGGNAQ